MERRPFDDAEYSEADKASARRYAQTKALLEPIESKSHSVSDLHSHRVSSSPAAPATIEHPLRSTSTRRVAVSNTGRQAIQTDHGQAHYYQAYLEASAVMRTAMLSRVKEQQASYDAAAAALLQDVSLDSPASIQRSSLDDHERDQKRLEADADQYASDFLASVGPAMAENMKFFSAARNEYLFASQERRVALTSLLQNALEGRSGSSGSNVSSGLLLQATRPVASTSRSPSITEETYVARAVVAFQDFGITARDARHNYREALKNPEELEGLEQTLVEREREKRIFKP